jgi:hypothetical protein
MMPVLDLCVGQRQQLVVGLGKPGVNGGNLPHGTSHAVGFDEFADLERLEGQKDHGCGEDAERLLQGDAKDDDPDRRAITGEAGAKIVVGENLRTGWGRYSEVAQN